MNEFLVYKQYSDRESDFLLYLLLKIMLQVNDFFFVGNDCFVGCDVDIQDVQD